MLVILDTNVLIAFSLTTRPPLTLIRDAWLTGELDVAVTETLIAEYARVMGYKHLATYFGDTVRQKRVTELYDFGVQIDVAEPYPHAPDPDDNYLFAMLEHPLVSALVTGDKALLGVGSFGSKPILTPAVFVEAYLQHD